MDGDLEGGDGGERGAALRPRGTYQKRGSGLRSAFMVRMRLASRSCCSSACWMATLSRSIQSGCGSAAALPKKGSSERMGEMPSRSWPDQAGLPWRVWTIERARS